MSFEEKVLKFIVAYYRFIAIGFLVLGIGCSSIIELKVENSIKSWADADSDIYQQYQHFLTEFGDDATLFAVYQYDDLMSVDLDDYLAFVDKIRESDGVSAVFDPVDMFLLNMDGTKLDELIINELRNNTSKRSLGFRDVLMSRDIKTLGMLILLDQNKEYLHSEIVQNVEQELANIGLHCRFAGTSYFSDTLSTLLTHDLTLVVTSLIIISSLILFWFFRSPAVLVCVITGIGLSLLYTLAFTSILQIKFNLLTLILFPLVFCIGITTSIHLFSRRKDGKWKLDYAYKKIFKPSLLTMLSTVIGCSAFVFAPQTIIRNMGLIFPVAISVTYIMMLVFVPSAYKWLANFRELPRLAISSTDNCYSRKNIIVSLFIFFAAITSIFQLNKLRTEPDAIYFFSSDSELIRSYKIIEERLTGLMVVDAVVETTDNTPVTNQTNIKKIEYFLNEALNMPELTNVISPLDWLGNYTEDLIPPEVNQSYLNDDKSSMHIMFRFRNISKTPFRDIYNRLQEIWDEQDTNGLNMHITGLLPMILDAQDALLKTQSLIFPFILILMTMILFLAFPSLVVLLSAILANILPLIITAGAMVLFKIPVNSINLFVASVMLGVIVDDTIHLLYAWHTKGSIERAMDEVKPALWITTMTIALAFSSLLFSSLKPVLQFGFLSILAVVVAYLCDVYLLPLLLKEKKVYV